MQVHRDCQKASSWYEPKELIANLLAGYDSEIITELQAEFQELLAHPSLLQMDEKTLQMAERWDKFCHDLFHAYQLNALREVNS